MEFNVLNVLILKLEKHNCVIEKESVVYTNDDIFYFGISKSFVAKNNKLSWGIVHIPSDMMFSDIFLTKNDASRFMAYLSKNFDLNCILFCTPKFDAVSDEIYSIISNARNHNKMGTL